MKRLIVRRHERYKEGLRTLSSMNLFNAHFHQSSILFLLQFVIYQYRLPLEASQDQYGGEFFCFFRLASR